MIDLCCHAMPYHTMSCNAVLDQVALRKELDHTDNVYKHVELQEAEERHLRDDELQRMRVEWLEQVKVQYALSQ